MPSRAAISRSAPRSGSVVNTRCRWAAPPSASSSHARTIRYCAIVSAVPPDLLMTFTSTRRGSMRAERGAASWSDRRSPARSGAERIRGPRRPSSFQAGRRSAVSSAFVPSAEPPMPSTSDVVVGLAQPLGEGGDLADRSRPDRPACRNRTRPRRAGGGPPACTAAKPRGQLGQARAGQPVRAVEAVAAACARTPA